MVLIRFPPYVPTWSHSDGSSLCRGKRRTAAEVDKRRKKGQAISPVVIEGRTIATHVLGQGLVRQPRILQRLRQPPAARPHLCPQRLGGGPADPTGQDHRAGERLRALRRSRSRSRRCRHGQWRSIKSRCARPDRLAGGAAARQAVEERDGHRHGPRRRHVSQAERDQDVVLLSGLGRHVQARRRRACTASERVSISSPSCSFCCARSIIWN